MRKNRLKTTENAVSREVDAADKNKISTSKNQTKMNNDHIQINDGTKRLICTKTFEVEGKRVTNSYLCNQHNFTVAESWNLLKQKKQFSRTAGL
jgi:hypothetical protein